MATAILVICLSGFALLAWYSHTQSKRIDWIADKVFTVSKSVEDLHPTAEETLDQVTEIKNVLEEASKIKAYKEAHKIEEDIRKPQRQKRFVGIAERRRMAEQGSMEPMAHSAKVIENNRKAMEG